VYQVAWAGLRICMSQIHKTKDACERSKQINFIDLIGQVHELYRSADPAALIGALDRLTGDPGSARGPVPGSAAATGSAGGHAGRWGDQ